MNIMEDMKKIVLKVSAFAIPVLIFNFLQQNSYFKGDELNNEKQNISFLTDSIQKYSSEIEEKRLLLAIAGKDNTEFEKYLKENKTLPWDAEILGGYLPHIATQASNLEVLEKLFELKPETVNLEGSIKKRTPIFSSLRKCDLKITQYLIDHGAKLEHRDSEGNTPIMYAAINGCYGGVVLLSQNKVNLKITNNENKDLSTVLGGSGLNYILNIKDTDRKISSEEE